MSSVEHLEIFGNFIQNGTNNDSSDDGNIVILESFLVIPSIE